MDLGHVTFGSVSDWSEEEEKVLEAGLAMNRTAEEDEGKFLHTLACTAVYLQYVYMYMYINTELRVSLSNRQEMPAHLHNS